MEWKSASAEYVTFNEFYVSQFHHRFRYLRLNNPIYTRLYYMKDTKECIAACQECLVACEICFTENIRLSSASMLACILLCRDCADICALCIKFCARNSSYSEAVCKLCVEVCRACAAECEKHVAHHDHCKRCAEACRKCVEVCAWLFYSIASFSSQSLGLGTPLTYLLPRFSTFHLFLPSESPNGRLRTELKTATSFSYLLRLPSDTLPPPTFLITGK